MKRKDLKKRLLKLGINFGTLFEKTGKSRQWGYALLKFDAAECKEYVLIGLAVLKEEIEQFEKDLMNEK